MNKVVCFGEALIDMLHLGTDKYQAFVGGAPANVAVGLAKLGGTSQFLGQVGNDNFGREIKDYLQAQNVNTDSLFLHPTANTALAFVQLDQGGDRSFSFYREQTADLLLNKSQIATGCFEQGTILHICSNTLTTPLGREVTEHCLDTATKQGLLISFDVNLREHLWPNSKLDLDAINRVIAMADIVKFSEEELDVLAAGQVTEYLAECFIAGVSLVLVTKGGDPVELISPVEKAEIDICAEQVVDTTGAGDSFISGFLYALNQKSDPAQHLADFEFLVRCVEFANKCSAITVSRHGACSSFPNASEVK